MDIKTAKEDLDIVKDLVQGIQAKRTSVEIRLLFYDGKYVRTQELNTTHKKK